MKVNEIPCKDPLPKSQLPGLDYAFNPYTGCSHGCIYCYSPHILRDSRYMEWGNYVDVKYDIATKLSKKIMNLKRGVVGVGTVTDCYQPLELKYELTRKSLDIFLRYKFPVSILTKSKNVIRDFDILKKFGNSNIAYEIGVTLTTLDDNVRKIFEPGTSQISERVSILEKANYEQLKTYIFLGPIIPFYTEDTLENIIDLAKECNVAYIMFDKLNLYPGISDRMKRSGGSGIRVTEIEQIVRSNREYFKNIYKKIKELSEGRGIMWKDAWRV